jgi:hypothetical protein
MSKRVGTSTQVEQQNQKEQNKWQSQLDTSETCKMKEQRRKYAHVKDKLQRTFCLFKARGICNARFDYLIILNEF